MALSDETASLLRRYAGFTDKEVAGVRRGGLVVRMIETGCQAEIAFAGAVRLPVKLSTYLERVRTGTLYKIRDPILQVGRFAETPSLDDLISLRFESYDLRVPAQRNKELLISSIKRYEESGATGFGKLGEEPANVDLAPLVRRSGYLRERMPAAYEYLLRYPKAASRGPDDFFLWKQLTIGFRPITRVAHVSVWEDNRAGRREALVLMKQIYANRYFDASYQVDHLISDRNAVYLITLNYGRSGFLDGLSGKMIRPIVLSRTRAAAEKTLREARQDFQSESQ